MSDIDPHAVSDAVKTGTDSAGYLVSFLASIGVIGGVRWFGARQVAKIDKAHEKITEVEKTQALIGQIVGQHDKNITAVREEIKEAVKKFENEHKETRRINKEDNQATREFIKNLYMSSRSGE